ncbi:MAG TPA: polysaccharide deacetylase family protein, partial [Solirubrobacteraceae bacterium]|nr:polysaccharide deacetylase family protein [Solirubrobacteraceae bacterium]
MTVVPVLLYHRVSEAAGDRFAVAPARFRAHLAAIRDAGRSPLTVSQLAAALRGERELPQRPVAITFDDGYLDTPDAVAALCEAGLSATVFITTGAVGRSDGIRAAQIRELAALGSAVELGAHTVSHPRLDELPAVRARAEIAGSKRALEALAGRPINVFAYPHGAYDARARELVREAGFRCAAAVKNALSHAGDDPWAIARMTVERDTPVERVRALIDGHGAPLAWAGDRLRTRAYRQVRRARRRL